MGDVRAHLMQIYQAGVRRVRGFEAVSDYLKAHPLRHDTHVVAVGKAASAMTLGAVEVCGERVIDGLVITKHNHTDDALQRRTGIQCIESDHPVPGAHSLCAGEALLEYLSGRAKGGAHFLFLLSGGASSLVEVPVKGIGLDGLRTLTERLLASGLDINRMNCVRRSVSAIKGGRLAAHLNGCATLSLMISDVPGDNPGVIGSGLLTAVRETLQLHDYPATVRELLAHIEPVPVPADDRFAAIETHIVACLDDAKRACEMEAIQLGYATRSAPGFIAGDVTEVAAKLYRQLRDSQGEMLIWGGEPTVRLPDNAGRGGRNQQLALALAFKIKDQGLYFLSAGTDGTDGPTAAAGGLVDGNTLKRGQAQGLDADDCLRRADAGVFLEASHDLITTGPTGTNVMDLMLGIRSHHPA